MKLHELEDLILAGWMTREDIDSVLWVLLDREKKPDEDEISNLLIGLHAMHDARMCKLFQGYDTVLKTNKVTYKGHDFSKNTPAL
jgi:hypothetical protein